MSRRLAIGISGFLLALVVSITGSQVVSALSNQGPSPNDFAPMVPSAEFAYSVSSVDHEFAAIPNTRVFLYFKNNTGNKTVTIVGGDICTDRQNSALNNTGGNYWDRPYKPGDPLPTPPPADWPYFGAQATRYSITAGNAIYGVFSASDTCYRDERTLTFPPSALTYDANTEYYKTAFNASIMPGYSNAQNHFKIRLSDGDAIVGYDAGLSENSTSLLRYNRDPAQVTDGYTDVLLPFAPDCTIDTTKTASGYWYDDDNDSPSTQPEKFWMQLQKYRLDTGAYAGSVPLTFIGAQIVVGGPVANSYYVTSGNKNNVRMDFTAEPGYKYIWRWNHVFHRNAIQFRMPFDSIYYLTGCKAEAATIRPSTVVDKPKITYPETANFTHYLNVTNFTHSGSANYSIQRYRNGAPIGGVQTGVYDFTAAGQFAVRANAFTSSGADAGDQICERLSVSEANGTMLNIVNNPSEACTTVVARPYMSVQNNDVWAGARFDYANNQCSGAAARLSKISSWVASGGGAVGEYGVFALGTVTEFGSGRQPGGDGLTFANTPANGLLGATTRCMPNYYGSIGVTGAEAWPGTGGVPANAGKKKYVVTGDINLGTWNVPVGTQVALLVSGNVTISGNINYADAYTNANAITSLWVVSQGNINIESGVTKVSGMFIGQGTAASPGKIQTCVRPGAATTYSPLTVNVCNAQLEVFGALKADTIYWQRTAGTAGSGTHAELVTFDPGLYLNSPLPESAAQLDIQDTKELPPIY